MTKFAQGFWGFLTARSATANRKRMAGVFVAWWAVFWAASALLPCCDILAAAIPHSHSLHLPVAAIVPASILQSEAFYTGYPQPPPLPRLYLHTSRLLI